MKNLGAIKNDFMTGFEETSDEKKLAALNRSVAADGQMSLAVERSMKPIFDASESPVIKAFGLDRPIKIGEIKDGILKERADLIANPDVRDIFQRVIAGF